MRYLYIAFKLFFLLGAGGGGKQAVLTEHFKNYQTTLFQSSTCFCCQTFFFITQDSDPKPPVLWNSGSLVWSWLLAPTVYLYIWLNCNINNNNNTVWAAPYCLLWKAEGTLSLNQRKGGDKCLKGNIPIYYRELIILRTTARVLFFSCSKKKKKKKKREKMKLGFTIQKTSWSCHGNVQVQCFQYCCLQLWLKTFQ